MLCFCHKPNYEENRNFIWGRCTHQKHPYMGNWWRRAIRRFFFYAGVVFNWRSGSLAKSAVLLSWNLSELLYFAGNMQLTFGRQQKDPVTLYNSRLQGAFVTWQEANVLLARQVVIAARPLCSPSCSLQQTCAVQDKCISSSGGELYKKTNDLFRCFL